MEFTKIRISLHLLFLEKLSEEQIIKITDEIYYSLRNISADVHNIAEKHTEKRPIQKGIDAIFAQSSFEPVTKLDVTEPQLNWQSVDLLKLQKNELINKNHDNPTEISGD